MPFARDSFALVLPGLDNAPFWPFHSAPCAPDIYLPFRVFPTPTSCSLRFCAFSNSFRYNSARAATNLCVQVVLQWWLDRGTGEGWYSGQNGQYLQLYASPDRDQRVSIFRHAYPLLQKRLLNVLRGFRYSSFNVAFVSCGIDSVSFLAVNNTSD